MTTDKTPLLRGIGNDIIEIDRIRKAFEEHGDKFLERLLTKQEQVYCLQHKDPALRLAGRFAAKEAVAKALGCGIGKEASWLDIEIVNDAKGKPEVFLSKKIEERFSHPKILLSLSHCKFYAAAVAISI